ncbi:MAG: tryptophan--tRNA ligase [Candidatus Saccharimonadales bacterium]
MSSKKRVLSGIKSSGEVTLGNYLGAMKRWAATQENQENFYFVPDLHVLNMRSMQQNPKDVTELTQASVAWLLAVGVDPQKSTIFLQSSVPAHSELSWILENYTYVGELNRMTQYKEKVESSGKQPIPAALYTYPVLMAADILLYDVDEVPVGEDQKQHVELTRDIAERFNNLYGELFKVPEPTLQTEGARIMNLQNPGNKMNKSDVDNKGNILLSDSLDTIKSKIMSAVTDSENKITYNKEAKPGISNLIEIAAVIKGTSRQEIEQEYQEASYSEFKNAVAELVIDELKPIKEKHQTIDTEKIKQVLTEGQEKAAKIAAKKLTEVKKAVGLLSL